MAIVVPWILIFIFLTLLTPINWTQMSEGFPQILTILAFSSVTFPCNVPLFGYGYVIPLFIWLVTGVLCGLACKSVMKGAVITLLGLFVNVLLFFALYAVNPNFLPPSLDFLFSLENSALLGAFSMDLLIDLAIFLGYLSLTLPSSVIGGILGGLISRSSVTE